MKIYLDVCSIQRPLDTKSQLRIILEADAVLGVITLCEAGQIELVASEAHWFEIKRNPHPARKRYALEVISRAVHQVSVTESVQQRARTFTENGIKSLDALHLASAIEAKADFFCTCDDRFYRRSQAMDTVSTKVVTPLELIAEIEK